MTEGWLLFLVSLLVLAASTWVMSFVERQFVREIPRGGGDMNRMTRFSSRRRFSLSDAHSSGRRTRNAPCPWSRR